MNAASVLGTLVILAHASLLQPAVLAAEEWIGAVAEGRARGDTARAQELARSTQARPAAQRASQGSAGGAETAEGASGAGEVPGAGGAGRLEPWRPDTASMGQCRDCTVHRDIDALEREVASQLRCPVCQQLSILDSPSEMAREARKVIRERLEAGQTPEEIKAYFVSKYGEWILLSPRKSGFNLLVWVLPALSIGVGAVVLGTAFRRWLRARGASAGADAGGRDEPEEELERAFEDLDSGE